MCATFKQNCNPWYKFLDPSLKWIMEFCMKFHQQEGCLQCGVGMQCLNYRSTEGWFHDMQAMLIIGQGVVSMFGNMDSKEEPDY